MRHGPHHSAQKSTRTLPGACSTSASKVSCDTASTKRPPRMGSRRRSRPGSPAALAVPSAPPPSPSAGAPASRVRPRDRLGSALAPVAVDARQRVEVLLGLDAGQRSLADGPGDLLDGPDLGVAAGEHARLARAQQLVGHDVAPLVELDDVDQEPSVGELPDVDEHAVGGHRRQRLRLDVLDLDALDLGLAADDARHRVPDEVHLAVGEGPFLGGLVGAQLVAAVDHVHGRRRTW